MALTTCPECDQEISTDAETCPNCGKDVRSGCLKAAEGVEKGGCCATILVTIPIAILIALLLA